MEKKKGAKQLNETYLEINQLSKDANKRYGTFHTAKEAVSKAQKSNKTYYAANSLEIGLHVYDELCDKFKVTGYLLTEQRAIIRVVLRSLSVEFY